MKRGKGFKYSILLFSIIISFFMFSKASVSAEEMIVFKGVSFGVEEIELGNPSSGYLISSATYSCDGSEVKCEIETLEFPDVYNGYPIIGIKEGSFVSDPQTANKTFYGTLDGLKNVAIGEIVVGDNIASVGDCAFCNLNVESVYFSEGVVNIGAYAFADSEVKKIYINRYRPFSTELHPLTNIVENTFAELYSSEYYILFPSGDVLNDAYIKHDAWEKNCATGKCTYEISYKYYDGEKYFDERIYYYGFAIDVLPDLLPESVDKVGFTFLGWYYSNDKKVVDGDKAEGKDVNGNYNVITSKWELTPLNVKYDVYIVQDEINTQKIEKSSVDKDSNIEVYNMLYSGDKVRLELVFDATTAVQLEPDSYSITYTWMFENDDEILSSNVSNRQGISFVSQSGRYTCFITYSYRGVTLRNEYVVKLVVDPREMVVNISDAEVEYGTYVGIDDFEIEIENEDSVFAEGEYWKYFDFKGYTNTKRMEGVYEDIPVGVYKDALEIKFMSIGYKDGGSFEAIDNYSITYNYGDLEVVPKKESLGYVLEADKKRIEYGKAENLTTSVGFVVYKHENGEIGKIVDVTYSRKDSDNKNVGLYEIDGLIEGDLNFDISLDSGKYFFEIVPKQVDVEWGTVEFTYDGEEKTLSPYYVSIDNKNVSLDVSVVKNASVAQLINAGEYLAVIDEEKIDSNYTLKESSKEIIVNKADSEFIGNLSQTVTYNGLVQTVNVSANHNESSVEKRNLLGECKGATTSGNPCKIEVSIKESENYKANSAVFSLYINKYRLYPKPDLFEIVYGTTGIGGYLTQDVEGVNGEVVKVKFHTDVNEIWDVGYHNIIGVGFVNSVYSQNYSIPLFDEEDGINKIKIVPAPVQIRFYFYENLVYNGEVFNIGVKAEGTNENVNLSAVYEDNKIPVNAGTYTLNASIDNDNFYIEGESSLTFEIAKANYDISSLSLKDKDVRFNFKSHSILLEGELPAGLKVIYTIDDSDGNGTFLPFKHTVKVTFEGDFDNYNYIEPMIATLNVSMTWVFVVFGVSVVVIGLLVFLGIYLIKNNKIRFTKRIKRSVFVKVMKKNKALEEINAIIVVARDARKQEEEIPFIEENVKFVKTDPVKVNTEIVSMSFVDELFKADESVKTYYSEIKNELLSYMGVTSKIKRDYETFYLNNVPIARVDIENGVLYAFYSLDPSMYNKQEYKHEDVSKKKEFGAVPMKLAVTSLEALRHAKMFVRIIRKRENIKSVSNFVRMDYAKVYTAKGGSLKLFKKVFSKKKKNKKEAD